MLAYEVTALDVVDSERAELRLDADESIVVLVTCWPFDAVDGRRQLALRRDGARCG